MSEETPAQHEQPAANHVAGGVVFRCDGNRHSNPAIEVETYNFRNPGFLSQADLRQLGIMQEKFVQHLSARLSTFLRMECVLKTSKFTSSIFGTFTEGIQSSTHVTLFQIEPLRGVGILDMSLPLALAIADRLLGGKGIVGEGTRGLTEIEIALLEDATQIILTEWCSQWDEENFRPECVGHETSGRFLQTSDADAAVLMMSLDVTFGESVQQIQMSVPFSMIEPVIKKMQQARVKGSEAGRKKLEWRVPFDGIFVPVTAEWLVKEMPVRDVLTLRAGDVIEMPKELIDRTQIRLSNKPEFIGTVGIENTRVAVQLTKRAL